MQTLVALLQGDLAERVRQALIAPAPAAQEYVLTGRATYYGAPSRFTFTFRPDGAFVQEVKGPLGETVGSDGSNYWFIDRSGAPRRLAFEDVDQWQAITVFLTDRWIEPGGPATLDADGYTVHVRLPGGMKEDVQVDPSTAMPVGASFQQSSGVSTVKVSDWRKVGPRLLPFRYELTEGGFTDVFVVETAQTRERSTGKYSPPPQTRPKDYRFDPTKPAALEVKRARTGHLLVHPLVDGKDVGWFIFDTGAEVMCIDPTVADELKMPKVGKLPLTGIGGTIESAFRRGKEITLGPLSLKHPLYTELDLKRFGEVFGVKLGGIVGYDYLYRCIAAVDVEQGSISVFDPARFSLPRGEWSTMLFNTGNPAVEATFEGDRKGWFILDTGSASWVAFHAPYVEEEKLLEGRETTESGAGGVGGVVSARAGQVQWFQLGGHRFENVRSIFSQGKQGAFIARGVAGNIGQALMKPFVVYFDFGTGRVAFVPKG